MSSEKQRDILGGMMVLGSGASGAGCFTVVLVIGAIFLGQWLDQKLGTEPWLLLILLFISIALSLIMMVRSALTAARTAQAQYAARKRHDSGALEEPTDTHDFS